MGTGKQLDEKREAAADQAGLRIDYQGPRLSPWRAAWLYAEVITSLYRERNGR